MKDRGDDGPQLPLTSMRLTPIEVDVDGLKDFRAFLVRELDTNLRPAAHGIANDHSMGVHFGGLNHGLRVRAARERYRASLEASTSNLAEYIRVAEVLITAIHEVSTTYENTDLSSAASTSKINAALADAFTSVTSAPVAEQRAQTQETQRELHRAQVRSQP